MNYDIKKIFFFILLSLPFSFECISQVNWLAVHQSKYEKLFKSGVNSIETIRQNKILEEKIYVFTKPKDSFIHCIINYDTAGFVKSAEQYKDGSILSREIFSYNESGQIIKSVLDYFKGKSKIIIKQYEYDSLGSEIKNYEYNGDTTTLTVVQKIFVESGNYLESLRNYNEHGFKVDERDYLDEKGNAYKIEKFGFSAKPEFDFISNDEKRNSIKITKGEKNRKQFFQEFIYNIYGKCESVTTDMNRTVIDGNPANEGNPKDFYKDGMMKEVIFFNAYGTISERKKSFQEDALIYRHYYKRL